MSRILGAMAAPGLTFLSKVEENTRNLHNCVHLHWKSNLLTLLTVWELPFVSYFTSHGFLWVS